MCSLSYLHQVSFSSTFVRDLRNALEGCHSRDEANIQAVGDRLYDEKFYKAFGWNDKGFYFNFLSPSCMDVWCLIERGGQLSWMECTWKELVPEPVEKGR